MDYQEIVESMKTYLSESDEIRESIVEHEYRSRSHSNPHFAQYETFYDINVDVSFLVETDAADQFIRDGLLDHLPMQVEFEAGDAKWEAEVLNTGRNIRVFANTI